MEPTAAACEAEAQGAQPKVDKREEESCRSCLYTGVATCAGLSAYFLHLAFEDHQPPSHQRPTDTTVRDYKSKDAKITGSAHTPKQNTDVFEKAIRLMQQKTSPKSNRQFHLAFSAVWAIAGIYRLYLN
jgi:hypothetical protein